MNAGDLDLTGQCALVTGGGGGIGRAIALCLADMGADVAIIESIPERCEETAERITERGRRALAINANVMEVDKIREAVARTKDEFGRLDILVNNAGGVAPRAFVDLKEKSWRRHIELNLVSVIVATQEAVPIMIEGGRGGSIINVSSIEGSRAAPNYAVYAACKAGINNMTRTLSLELAEHGVRVNAICPGNLLDSPLWVDSLYKQYAERLGITEEQVRQKYVDQVPMKRGCSYDDVCNVVVFLASDQSSYMTGQAINVTGGQEMR